MRELAIVREVARDHAYLAGLVLLLGGLLVWIYAEPAASQPRWAAPEIGEIPRPSAWGWGLLALVPCSLWAGVVAGAPPRPMLFALARPIGRARMFIARAVGASLPMLVAAAAFAVIPVQIAASETPFPPLGIGVASCLAFVAGGLGGCARDDEPFALAVAVLLVTVQGAGLVFVFSTLGVGVYRPFEAMSGAWLPILASTAVVGSWPLLDLWRVVLPLRGSAALRRAALRWFASTAVLAILWTPVALWAGRPARGHDHALIAVTFDGHAWVATGIRGDPTSDAPTDGLILVAPDGARRDVAVWTRAGAIWGLGTPAEVQEIVSSNDGTRLAVLLTAPARVDLVDAHGVIASSPTLPMGGYGRGSRWSAEGGRFAFLRRSPHGSSVGVLDATPSGLRFASYDVSELGARGILASCDDVLVLGDARKDTPVSLLQYDIEDERVLRVVSMPRQASMRSRFAASRGGCKLARAAVWDGRLKLWLYDAREVSPQPVDEIDLPAEGFADVQSVVWLDERHVVVSIGDLGRSRMRLVVRDDGAIVARHATGSGSWGLDAAYGPPAGPWIFENGVDLSAVVADGTTIWQATLPFLSAESGPQPAVVRDGRVRWLKGGRTFDMPVPWTTEAAR